MIIIGDSLVPFEEIFNISNIEDIKNTKANSIVAFNYDDELLKYCYENDIRCLIRVDNIKQAIYCNSLKADFIVSDFKLATAIQKIADNYMFDAKNLCVIENNDSFEDVANNEIDGVIYAVLLDNK